LAAFCLLYVTEGIPLGFTATALATLMRKQGLSTEQIGYFVATLYLPWSFKWIVGPLVDLVYSTRLGKRRAWIVGCQTLMAWTLLCATGIDFVEHFLLFTGIILLLNVYSATMDVAIDALACTVLPPEERGTANGLMFAGAYVGNGLGGAGVLFLLPYMPVQATFLLVAGAILLVDGLVSLRLVEPAPEPATIEQPRRRRVWSEIANYTRSLLVSCLGSRAAIAGLLFAVLPCGAYGLGLALQSNLAVELGLEETQIGWLNVWSTVLAATGCVAGGLLSDRLGRRRMLAVYVLATLVPTLWLASELHSQGWIMPREVEPGSHITAPAGLIRNFWIAACTYNFAQGLMAGTRTAIYMDMCKSVVAATQFTAYMSLMNLAFAYSASWQGKSANLWGYPMTLAVDAAVGCICLIPLAFITVKQNRQADTLGSPEMPRQD
jgi:PAT family beta-lactamase induction signal transducer AmpG